MGELGAAGGRSYEAGDVAADALQQTSSFPEDSKIDQGSDRRELLKLVSAPAPGWC